ncbi:cAMP-independent regulatory protein pac2 [Tolypocladium ophioglossoides CBS 100239]|uniref:cAMP-independent regulatory protein pac2 n=1 Tax=Tolypocladium ophioglossoides (strain CBS 100239) TaxID=1163406 RepID=A0A0L0N5L2_TOLOC|nr:cAMP-independent regulatory protein pac2 [Tolypocladium ophioglossoides CBS 100239]
METYHGYVRTPGDAIKLFEACRLGLLPRVQRRLSEKERQSIRSGSVFVWDEREAGMRRWTDGKSWSASRVSGSFLTYREMEGKRGGGFGSGRRGAGKTPDSGRGSDEDHDDGEPEGYRYKADGLMKQSFSITTSTGQHLHLISYYSRPQPGQPDLPQPSSDVSLRGIVPPKGMYPESSMGETNQTPALTRAPMQQPYMIAPHHPHAHHQQPYAPHYAQPGYGWPPSPAATPPYGHYAPAPYPPHVHHLPHPHPHVSQPPLPPQAYSQSHYTHASPYERASLPPLHNPKPTTLPPYPGHHASHGLSPPRLHDSPRQKDLQAAALAVMGDVHLSNGSARSSHGSLPTLNAVANGTPASSHAAMATPPTRNLSVSPPRTSHVDGPGPLANGGHRSSLTALLHPTPSSSEPNSAKPASSGSGSSSPRAGGATAEKGGVSEDARALRMLDRKFCI